jgi:transposase-like protein
MDTRKLNNEIKMNQWMEIIRECRNSGQSVRSWCLEHGVNDKSYYYWLKKVRIAACNTLPDNLEESRVIVPLKVEDLKQEPEVAVSSQVSAIVIRLNSAVVEIQNGATSSVIENTLRAIKNLC